MAFEWPRRTFGELMSSGELEIGDGYRAKNAELGENGSGLIFLRAGHVSDSHINFSGAERFLDTKGYAFGAKVSRVGDVIVTTKGNSTGRVAFVSQGMPKFVYSPHLSYWRATSEGSLHQGFLRAWARSSEFSRQLLALSRSTDMAPYLSLTDQRRLEITIPPREIQAWIGQAADDLHERIEILRRTNKTLEAIAQAIFKSWFVDFDPVRAKAEGREPEGMEAGTADLFPSRFHKSDLGSVPDGWRVARLENLIDAERGLSYKGAGLADSEAGLPMHNLNSVLEGGGYKRAGIKFYKANYKDRHIARAGDVIVANTEQGHHHRLIGFPAIIPRRYEKGLFSHHLYRVRPKDDSPVTRHWIYHALMVPRVRDQIIGCANGSTVNMLKPAGLQIPRLIVPPRELCVRFEAVANLLYARIDTNVECADALVALRDTLIPRLISGKLKLPEVDEMSELAAPDDALRGSQKVN